MRELIYSYPLNLYRKIKEKKTVKLQMKKMSTAIEENKLTVTIKDLCENSVYTGNLCVQTNIIIRI